MKAGVIVTFSAIILMACLFGTSCSAVSETTDISEGRNTKAALEENSNAVTGNAMNETIEEGTDKEGAIEESAGNKDTQADDIGNVDNENNNADNENNNAGNPPVYTDQYSIFVKNDRIYYSNHYDGDVLYSCDLEGNDIHALTDIAVSWFNITKDQIFLTSQEDDDNVNLYVMDTDGSNLQMLCTASTNSVFLAEDKIFFGNFDDNGILYCMNPDGSDLKKLSDDIPVSINVRGDVIYFAGKSGGTFGIYRMNTDGTDKEKSSSNYTKQILAAGDWIYYNRYLSESDEKFCALRIDGSESRSLCDSAAQSINVVGDLVYYYNSADRMVYTLDVSNEEQKVYSSFLTDCFVIADNVIYYSDGRVINCKDVDGYFNFINIDLGYVDGYGNAGNSCDNDPETGDIQCGELIEPVYEITESLHEGMPEYRFVAKGLTYSSYDWYFGYVISLEVFDESGDRILFEDYANRLEDQTYPGTPIDAFMIDTMGLHVVDVNLDGYQDVIILKCLSEAHDNSWYDCWLWDPETSTFVESETFETIANPALDAEKKCIYSTGGSGAGCAAWNIFQYIDGEFLCTNTLEYQYDMDLAGFHFVETKLENGEMVVIRDDVYTGTYADALEESGYQADDLWQLGNAWWYGSGGHHADQWLEDKVTEDKVEEDNAATIPTMSDEFIQIPEDSTVEYKNAVQAYDEFISGNIGAQDSSLGVCGDPIQFSDIYWNEGVKSSIAVYDMNNDGIPELHILPTAFGGYNIYTYHDGQVVLWYGGSEYEHPLDNGAILYVRPGGAPTHSDYWYAVLDNDGNVLSRIYFSKYHKSEENGQTESDDYEQFFLEENEVSKEEWEARTREYLSASDDSIVWYKITK